MNQKKKVFSIVMNPGYKLDENRYFLVVNQKQFGPYPLEEIRKMKIPANTLIWTEGMDDWLEARLIFDKEILSHPTPPPIPNEKNTLSNYKPRRIKYPPAFKDSLMNEVIQNLKILLICLFAGIIAGFGFYGFKKGFRLKSELKKYYTIQNLYDNKKINSQTEIKMLKSLDLNTRKLGLGQLIFLGDHNSYQEIEEKLIQLKTDSIQAAALCFIFLSLLLIFTQYFYFFITKSLQKKVE